MPLFRKKTAAVVKAEADKGTAESAAMLDAYLYNLTIYPDAETVERDGTSKYFGSAQPDYIGAVKGKCNFDIDLRGNGTDALDPALSAILTCCSMKNAAETYTPTSIHATQETLTILVYEDGEKKGLRGAAGKWSFKGEFGKSIMIHIELEGGWIAPITAAMPETFTPSTEVPPKLAGATFTVGGAPMYLANIGFDSGNIIAIHPDITAVGGVGYMMVSGHKYTMSMDPEAVPVATYDINGLWLAGTPGAVSLVIGAGAGKQITITAPALQWIDIPEGEREGVLIYDANAKLINSSGDDAISIAVATS